MHHSRIPNTSGFGAMPLSRIYKEHAGFSGFLWIPIFDPEYLEGPREEHEAFSGWHWSCWHLMLALVALNAAGNARPLSIRYLVMDNEGWMQNYDNIVNTKTTIDLIIVKHLNIDTTVML